MQLKKQNLSNLNIIPNKIKDNSTDLFNGCDILIKDWNIQWLLIFEGSQPGTNDQFEKNLNLQFSISHLKIVFTFLDCKMRTKQSSKLLDTIFRFILVRETRVSARIHFNACTKHSRVQTKNSRTPAAEIQVHVKC